MLRYRNGCRLRCPFLRPSARHTHSLTSKWKSLRELPDGHLETFRHEAFTVSRPALLPRGHFESLPAIQKWFVKSGNETSLNHDYLSNFGAATVPLELTHLAGTTVVEEITDSFQRAEVPLQMFLDWTKLATAKTPERLYLAQASLSTLPQSMTENLPAPDYVTKAGTGDIYDTNLWMGIAPTYTPLHKDPNPNLFVQLAGHKIVRMLPPTIGDDVFRRVRKALGRPSDEPMSAAIRGDEMMKGREKRLLEDEIWNSPDGLSGQGYEVHVWGGDGVFIPTGWWHSVKGVDEGILGSVNWWFR